MESFNFSGTTSSFLPSSINSHGGRHTTSPERCMKSLPRSIWIESAALFRSWQNARLNPCIKSATTLTMQLRLPIPAHIAFWHCAATSKKSLRHCKKRRICSSSSRRTITMRWSKKCSCCGRTIIMRWSKKCWCCGSRGRWSKWEGSVARGVISYPHGPERCRSSRLCEGSVEYYLLVFHFVELLDVNISVENRTSNEKTGFKFRLPNIYISIA